MNFMMPQRDRGQLCTKLITAVGLLHCHFLKETLLCEVRFQLNIFLLLLSDFMQYLDSVASVQSLHPRSLIRELHYILVS